MSKTQINSLLLAVILVNLCAIFGCHRSYYRRQADAEALRLIREKAVDPRWNGIDGDILIDPQSRMFDPFSQDHPPIPPDDASSHQLMHCVDGNEGYPQWHANGDTNYVENPEWKSYLPMNEKGQVVLNLERAFQLALINSPDYQAQREALYLSALNVSLERFGFDSQLFVGNRTIFGMERGNSSLRNSLGVNGGGITLERLGTSGATFVVGLANTILFNFGNFGAGSESRSSNSLINFAFVQPLLRGAGRDRILESLTQAERDLLADIRQIERFRRGFYLDIAVGRDPGINVNTALLNFPGSANIGQAGGFLGLLDRRTRIRNQELNVRQQAAVLEQFREFFKSERFDAVQLKRFESSFLSSQRQLLNLKTSYQDELDRYKVLLGLPPELDVIIEDSFLDQFNLISDQVNNRLITIKEIRDNIGITLNDVDELFTKRDKAGFEWPTDIADRVEALLPYIEQAQLALEMIVTEDRQQLEDDLQRLDDHRPRRLEHLRKLNESIEKGEILSEIDPSSLQPSSIPTAAEIRVQIENPELDDVEFVINEDGEQEIPQRSIIKRAGLLKEEFQATQATIAGFRQLEPTMTQDEVINYIILEFQEKIPGQLSELNTLMLELSLLQATARSNSIEIADVEIRAEQAIRVARCFRRDWMNARAALVDNWRNIEFVADQLESQVDLILEGDMSNDGEDVFSFQYATGQIRGGLRFDLPIVRLAERNNYRAALINYQQTKRRYYQFEDSIKQNIRRIIRFVDQNKVLFELDRRTVQVSIENIEVNRFELDKPVPPGASNRLGATTAQNLSDAIQQLNQNQNQYLSSWVQMEVLRRNLDYDMGTMQLNALGEWIDPGTIDTAIGINAAAAMGIQLDCQFCENIDVAYDSSPIGEGGPSPTPAEAPAPVPDQPQLESETAPGESDAEKPTPNNAAPANVPNPDTPKLPDVPKPNAPEIGAARSTLSPEETLARIPSLLSASSKPSNPVLEQSKNLEPVPATPTANSFLQSLSQRSSSSQSSGSPASPISAIIAERQQATSVGWNERTAADSIRAPKLSNAKIEAFVPTFAPESDLIERPESPRRSYPRSVQTPENSPRAEQTQTAWAEQSSLGGVLSRFKK